MYFFFIQHAKRYYLFQAITMNSDESKLTITKTRLFKYIENFT